jgi:hypothetical protein
MKTAEQIESKLHSKITEAINEAQQELMLLKK